MTGSRPTRSRASSAAEKRLFETLYREHLSRVSAYLLARTDRHSAEEALGRTFEIAWRRLQDLPPDPLPWLLGVARRVLAEQRRATGRQNALIQRLYESAALQADDHSDRLAQRGVLLAAIGKLTPAQQETLTLVAWDGLSERQAAAAMGCSRGAVALRLHRARRQLRGALERSSDGENLSDPPSESDSRPAIHATARETP